MDTMKELIEECLRDILSAEKQLVKAMPRLAKAAQNPQLKESITNHVAETQEQIKRLEACLKEMGFKSSPIFCKGAAGIVEEMSEHLKEAKPSPVTDAMIVGLAQKGEHYEICSYGTVFEYMKAAGMNDAVERLKPNMAEEEKTDKLLSELAESGINRLAAEAPESEPKKPARASSSNGKASASKSSSPRGKASVH
jgi:ferritin-like metal-binding protein YciE